MTARILVGDVCERLATLESKSVQCVVTSPPYWGLRDYGVEGQLGLEASPQEYIARMVEVFREVRRVMRDDATLWLNMGDGYISRRGCGVGKNSKINGRQTRGMNRMPSEASKRTLGYKQLVGMPWRLALALQDDGWLLRAEVIWHKANPMPESVADRPTRDHEQVFLFAKQPRYYYNTRAGREPVSGGTYARGSGVTPKGRNASPVKPGTDTAIPGGRSHRHEGLNGRFRQKQNASFSAAVAGLVLDRNMRTVWRVSSQPCSEAHFAAFPEELVHRCLLCGTQQGDTVLDPFAGTGTVGVVAIRHACHFVGIELNPSYVAMATSRIERAERHFGASMFAVEGGA